MRLTGKRKSGYPQAQMRAVRLIPILLVFFLFQYLLGAQAQRETTQKQKDEEIQDYFERWLKQDVIYIISLEEKSVFQKLTRPEEKERFIEQFWARRDTDPTTAINEYKEEHYRRIAFTNEHFKAGRDGWLTDRGQIYIIHGPPANRLMRPMGGAHKRTLQEGGGATTTFPHEVWTYRYIEGIGIDIEFEFVDSGMNGNYRLALTPDEKDALLYTSLGATLEEQLGYKTRADRIREQTLLRSSEDVSLTSRKSSIQRLLDYFQAFSPPEITYGDLKQVVDLRVNYDQLPISSRADFFWVAEEQFLVPVTLQVANHELTYKADGGVAQARVDIYASARDLMGRMVREFEDSLYINQPSQEALEKGHALYQHSIPLEAGRYKLDWVVRDVHSGRLGTFAHGLVLPHQGLDRLFTSSLVLADRIRAGSDDPLEPFNTLSGLKVYPNVKKNTFIQGERVGVYFEVYNAVVDSASGSPALRVLLRIHDSEGQVIEERSLDQWGLSYRNQRAIVSTVLGLGDMAPGAYQAKVSIQDSISGQEQTLSSRFRIRAENKGP